LSAGGSGMTMLDIVLDHDEAARAAGLPAGVWLDSMRFARADFPAPRPRGFDAGGGAGHISRVKSPLGLAS